MHPDCLTESNMKGIKAWNAGKWMLFYPNDKMNEMWKFAQEMYKEGKVPGVNSMKCSTAKGNPRASSTKNGIIILYSSYSADEQYITKVGQNILATFGYPNSLKFITTPMNKHLQARVPLDVKSIRLHIKNN